MEIDNESNYFVLMEIQIWNNKDSNRMFYYNYRQDKTTHMFQLYYQDSCHY